jgi:hypothetical protein
MTPIDVGGVLPTPSRYSTRPDGPATNRDTPQSPVAAWSAGAERAWWVAWFGMVVVFSAVPIANQFLGLSTKDYGLWYQVGLAVRQGFDIYPRPESHRLFPFMYPPSAAAMLAWVSLLGPFGSLLAMVTVNSLSWLACILLSVWLATGRLDCKHPLVVIVPSLSIIVLVYNIYLLGQPNLLLLALLLSTFACLRLRREFSAGIFLATAAAIKAFPILALAYLVYRRMWKAVAATCLVLAAWLLIAPLSFRTPAQVVDDLVVWSQGMVFTYNAHGIAQRPFRSYSYKNQSIMALAHRLLRDVPADGESVLSRKARVGNGSIRPTKGIASVDPPTDLLAFLKPHLQDSPASETTQAKPAESTTKDLTVTAVARSTGAAEQFPRWDEVLQGAESELRAAWRVNFVDLDFRVVTVVTGVAMMVLSVFVAAVMPPRNRRTSQTDAIEFALVSLLTVMFSPLSFNYAYVWLIYPTTLGLYLVLSEQTGARRHWLKVGWIVMVLGIPALAVPMPLRAQAYGNLFLPALLLVIGLGAILQTYRRSSTVPSKPMTRHAPQCELHVDNFRDITNVGHK